MLGETNGRVDLLRRAIDPLMKQILRDEGKLDVTKLNIAVTGFADIAFGGIVGTDGQQRSMEAFFAGQSSRSVRKKSSVSMPVGGEHTGGKRKAPASAQTLDNLFQANESASPISRPLPKKRADTSMEEHQSLSKIDPSFLAALPPDLRAEVLASNQVHNAERLRGKAGSNKKKKGVTSKGRIDNFFRK